MEDENKNIEETKNDSLESNTVETSPVVEESTPPVIEQGEKEEPVQKKKKSPILLIVIIIVFMLLTFGLGIYFGKEVFANKGNNNKPNKDNNTNIEVDNTNIEVDNTNTETPITPDEKAHNSLIEKGEEYDTTFIPNVNDSRLGLEAKILTDKQSVKVTLHLDDLSEYYAINLGKGEYSKTISFNKEVKQVFIGFFGQAAGGEALLFVMADGSVEYIPIYNEVKKDNWASLSDTDKLNSYGALEGVTSVEYVYYMQVDGFSGYYSVGAARKDGTFYNLFEFLKF